MEKIKINMSGNTFVNKAIKDAGGKSVGRANANLVGGASANVANINQGVAALPKMPKKASGDDLLSHITDGQEEDLKYYIMEKAAGFPIGWGHHIHMGGVDKIVTRSPLPAASSTLYRYGGGLVGGAAAYGAARNDGQGVGGALGFGAVGALGGNMLGNRVGREVALHGNIAKGKASAALHSTHDAELKSIEKFTHPTDGAAHIAEHLMNERKGLLTRSGGNAMETVGNIAKGTIAHASDWASKYVNPNLSKVEQYRNTVGHAKADENIANFKKTITDKQQKINEQTGAGRAFAKHWADHGVHDAAERYGKMGLDIHTVANLQDPMGHWSTKQIAGETGNRGNKSLFNSNAALGFSYTASKQGPFSNK